MKDDYLLKIAGYLFWVVFIGWAIHAWNSRGEKTVYILFCVGEMVGGDCKGKITTASKTTYKTIFENQTVVSKDDNSAPERLKNCSVWDENNWICSESGRLLTYEKSMIDGRFSNYLIQEGGQKKPLLPPTFYYGSGLEWWLTHIGNKINP